MALFIDGFSCEVVPRQSPGDSTGVCHAGHRFIYMTGSGAWSRLLEPGPLDVLLGEASLKIPMGYNQLWVFEKKLCAAPAPDGGRSGLRLDQARRSYPEELERHRWPGRLHVVLQDPQWARHGPVVLSYHVEPGEAAAYAAAQATELCVRTIVGLLLADVTWH